MKISRLLLALFFSAAASFFGDDELKERLQPALEAITPDGLLAHIKVLASDEFEGRAPGSKGEELSVSKSRPLRTAKLTSLSGIGTSLMGH